MTYRRIDYSEAQQTALVSQVSRICPLCLEPLFYKKKSRTYKNYELAHIYPLNPSETEAELLAGEIKLSNDVNDEDNIIPLCKICHGQFDKPRTVEEYRTLVELKRKAIDKSSQQNLWKRYEIESQIGEIIKAIYNSSDADISAEIELLPKRVDDKINDTMSRPTCRKIKNNVRDYYMFIRERFQALDQSEVDLSENISLQIKAYYLKQKRTGASQQAIFENMVDWINAKTHSETLDAPEILAAFFVQNCEIFE